MRRALFHAARGQGRTTPNPMVGAVVVSAEGVLVGQGWHERAGEAHAEVNALDAAGDAAAGGTLYVTLEPCCHVGRTGPCTERIRDAGIRRVVAAMRDPDPRVSGQGFIELRGYGIDVEVGVCERDALRLNAPFLTVMALGRPLILFKAATTIDNCVAARRGERTSLTSAGANRRSHLLRAAVDALAVGSETMLVDDPLLTARACVRIRPLVRVVFDRRLRTPPTSRLFSTLDQGPVLVMTRALQGEAVTRAARLAEAGATVLETASLADAMSRLLQWQVSTVLVEGGPELQRALAAEGLVDRVHLIVTPRVAGGDGVRWLGIEDLALSFASPPSAEARGADIWIEADVHGHR